MTLSSEFTNDMCGRNETKFFVLFLPHMSSGNKASLRINDLQCRMNLFLKNFSKRGASRRRGVMLWEEGADVATEMCELAHDGAGDGGEGGVGEEDDGVDAGEPTVDVGHLELVLVVLDGTYAAQDGCGADGFGVVGGEAGVGAHAHARFIDVELPDHSQALVDGLPTGFLLVDANGYDDFVEELEGTADEVGMAEGEGVERAGEEDSPPALPVREGAVTIVCSVLLH